MEIERIKEIMAERLKIDAESINEKTSFTKDLGLDSLDIFQLMAEIEDEFEVDLDIIEGAQKKIKTVGDAVNLLKTLI